MTDSFLLIIRNKNWQERDDFTRMFIIRADGNGTIGMGHVMRCMSIAGSLQKLGEKPVFLTACEESRKTIEDNGFIVRLLPTDYRNMESEIPYVRPLIKELRKMIGEPEPPEIVIEQPNIKKKKLTEIELAALPSLINVKKPDVILLDSYQATYEYVIKLREVAMIAYLEDLGNSMPVDLIINYNIYGMRYYYTTLPSVPLKVMLGPQFIPLRREFSSDLDYELREEVKNVMLTTGGSDPCFASKNILNALLRCNDLIEKGIKFHVISGPYNKFADQLKRIYGKNPNVVIHENVKSMKEIMKQCDIVVSAAGSTVYEVCALGVPLICFHFVENQSLVDEMLPLVLPIKSFGDYTSSPIYTSKEAAKLVQEYVYDYEYRKRLYTEERALVDGQGARRVAEGLIELGQEFYKSKETGEEE